MVTWLVVVVVVYWVVNWATPCWCRRSGMFCFGGKFAFELLDIDSSAPLSHGRYLALCIYYLWALTVVVIFVKKTAVGWLSSNGPSYVYAAAFSSSSSQLDVQTADSKNNTSGLQTCLDVCNCSFIHWKLNPLPITRKSEPQYSLIPTYCTIRH